MHNMKKAYLVLSVLLAVLFGVTCSVSAEPGPDPSEPTLSNRSKDGIHGPARSAEFQQGYLLPENGEWVEAGMTPMHRYVYAEGGRRIETLKLDKKGRVWKRTVIADTNAAGQILREDTYDNKGVLSSHTTYEYNQSGNLISKKIASNQGNGEMKVLIWTDYTHNENGQQIKSLKHSGKNGSVREEIVSSYYPDGMLKEEVVSGNDGLDYRLLYSYENGTVGTLTKPIPLLYTTRIEANGDTLYVHITDRNGKMYEDRNHHISSGVWEIVRLTYTPQGDMVESTTTAYKSYGEALAEVNGTPRRHLKIEYQYDEHDNWTRAVWFREVDMEGGSDKMEPQAVQLQKLTYF